MQFLKELTRDHVIDVQYCLLSLARFTNDASGSGRLQGMRNNGYFEFEGLHVFLTTSRPVAAGAEILTNYGIGYW